MERDGNIVVTQRNGNEDDSIIILHPAQVPDFVERLQQVARDCEAGVSPPPLRV